MTRQRRVAVSSPQTRVALARRHTEYVGQPPHLAPGDLERARRAHREQLRWALVAVMLLGGLIVGIPVLLAAIPAWDDVRVGGIPVSWLAVGVLPYPLLIALTQWQLRRAERIERDP
ncbi:MAG: hypothetical protein L0H84_21090 [Pseudonocardia sp.]|nr:hypothetical protein [Pseudonocardia sp.]